MQNLAFIDESFDYNKSHTYHLSIQLSSDGFSYCILDTYENKHILFKHFVFNENNDNYLQSYVTEILNQETMLTYNFKDIKFLWNYQFSTLVPTDFFDIHQLDLFHNFNIPLRSNYEPYFNKLNLADTFAIFSLPTELKKWISTKFPSAKIYHQSSVLIQHFMMLKDFFTSSIVCINVQKEIFDILVIQSQKLILFNTFQYINEVDFIYFTMNVFKQLKLNNERNKVLVIGYVDENDKIINQLSEYILNVKIHNDIWGINYSKIFDEIPYHKFYNLLNLYNCE